MFAPVQVCVCVCVCSVCENEHIREEGRKIRLIHRLRDFASKVKEVTVQRMRN